MIKKISESELLKDFAVKGMKELKAKKIIVLDLRKIEQAVTDFFVICEGTSTTQVDGIAESVEKEIRENLNDKPWRREGKENAQWILLDYFDIVVHVFLDEYRGFYNLEGLWADAEIETIED
jgi:ribosome-associated protein